MKQLTIFEILKILVWLDDQTKRIDEKTLEILRSSLWEILKKGVKE